MSRGSAARVAATVAASVALDRWRTAAAQPGETPSSPDAPVSSNVQRRATLAGLRILVVEDDPDARELVTAVLSTEGAVVTSAESAQAGFDAVAPFRPQLIISDIAMPGEDGYSLIRRIRALEASAGGRVPSVALSAFTRAEDRLEALRAGFTLHIGKPVLPSELVSALVKLVQGAD